MKESSLRLVVMLCLMPAGNLQAAPLAFARFDASSVLQVQLSREFSHELGAIFGKVKPQRIHKDVIVDYRGVKTKQDLEAGLRKYHEDSQRIVCSILREHRETPSSCVGQSDGNR